MLLTNLDPIQEGLDFYRVYCYDKKNSCLCYMYNIHGYHIYRLLYNMYIYH